MMGASAAIRLAGAGGGKGQAAADAPVREADGFPAALTAASKPGARAAGGADRDTGSAASDPALAAALAAMLPVPALPDGAPLPPQPGELSIDDMAGDRHAPAAAQDLLDAAAQLPSDDVIEAQLATMDEGAAADDVRDGLLQQLARELALARDPAAPLRAGATEMRSAPNELAPGSVATHAATQLSGLTPQATAALAHAGAQALHSPVGTPRWAEELGARLVMMTTRGQGEGSLTLAPEHLGPLEVRISMNQNTANVWFGAQHADTRAALAEALPRLRELLAESGLSLGHAGVSHEAPREQAGREPVQARHAGSEVLAASAETPAQAVRRAVSSLLDLYA